MDSQVEKLKQEIQGLEEFQQMLEEQIKEYEETIDKHKRDLSSQDNEIKNLKKQLHDAKKQADVLGNTDDVSGTKIIQLEVEIHDLNQKLQEADQEIKQLKDKIKQTEEDSLMEIEILKDEHLSKEKEFNKLIESLKNQTHVSAPKANTQAMDDELYDELERLTSEVQEKSLKIEVLEKQIEKLQLQDHPIKANSDSQDVSALEQKIQQLEELLQHQQEENSAFTLKEEKFEQQAKQKQEQIIQLQNQIQELQENQNDGPTRELEDLKLQYEELVQEYTILNEKLQVSEEEVHQLTEKGQEYFTVKEQLQEQIQLLEDQLKHHNEILEENNELKLLINKAKEDLNNLESNNEYQTLFLQIRDEYEEFKEHVSITLKEKEQQLYQAAQLCQEYDILKEQALMQEQNNQLLTKQLQTQLENNEINQQKVENLEEELNKTREAQSELTDIKLQLNQLKEENENLKSDNYMYQELLKDYEIQMEALKQIECDSPRKISKLQLENSEATTELINLKETTSREIHLLKQEKSQFQGEINELKAMMDAYISSEAFEPKIQYIIEYWNKLQNIQDEQNNLVEKFQMEIQDLTENIGQIQSLQNLSVNNQVNEENVILPEEVPQETLTAEIESKSAGFHLNLQQVAQIQYTEQLVQTEETLFTDCECQTDEQQSSTLIESKEEKEEKVLQKETQDSEIQTDEIEVNYPITIEFGCQIPEEQYMIEEENKVENQEVSQEDQQVIKKLMGQEADCNTSFDFAAIESLKKKVEDLDTLRAAQEKENQTLKEKIKKLEDKVQSFQKPQTPRRQSDTKQEPKKQQNCEQIQRYQKQVKELQEQIEQFNAHQLNEQIEQQSNEIEQLQEELAQYREQLTLQRKKTLQYKAELEKIYNLGPAALQQLRTEPKKEQPEPQVYEKYPVSLYLYLKSQRQYQCPYLEFNRKTVKMFTAVKGKIEKSMFDTFLFDEIFFDTQKIHQFLEGQKVKLQCDNTKVSLILGQSKTHKKLIMIMLIELLYNAIAKLEITQKITLSYQERIGKQWIELEQFNIEAQTINELDYAIQNIKVHLLTKQKSQGEKIRKLQIVHQTFYQQEVQSNNQFLIVTCPSIPQGDFKTVVTKILNQQITPNYQFNIFLTIVPTLQQYKQSAEILFMAKIAKQAKNVSDFSSLTTSKSVSELITDDESQKQVRMANNKLILKQQEIEQQKKQIDVCRRQLVEMQAKHDGLQGYLMNVQSLINSLILDIKAKINLKMNQKKNKKSQNVAYLDKLAIQLDATIRKSTPSAVIVDNNSERFKSKASEIMNPFM